MLVKIKGCCHVDIEIKILRVFGQKVTYILSLFTFLFFLIFLLLLFLLSLPFCCSDWSSTGLVSRLKTSEKTSSIQASFAMEQPRVVAGNFAPSFSLSFWAFYLCAYFRLHWANHSHLGIIGKIFSSAELKYRWCQFWSVMSIFVRRGTKANSHHGRLQSARALMGEDKIIKVRQWMPLKGLPTKVIPPGS